jgi:hypothetical protein
LIFKTKTIYKSHGF